MKKCVINKDTIDVCVSQAYLSTDFCSLPADGFSSLQQIVEFRENLDLLNLLYLLNRSSSMDEDRDEGVTTKNRR